MVAQRGVYQAAWVLSDGRRRRLLTGGETWWVEEESKIGWVAIHPNSVGVADLIALASANEPKRSQESQIETGTLEGIPIPPEFLAKGERFKEALKAWCKVRFEKKNKVTRTVAKRTFQKLQSWSNPELAVQALEQSADNGWTGVFLPHRLHKVALADTINRQESIQAMRQKGK